MVTSLKFNKIVNVNIGNTGKFKVGDNENVLTLKDIPAVRYQFETYGDAEIAFISEIHKKFKHSVHVVELDLMEHNIGSVYTEIHKVVDNIATIVHLSLDDTHAESRDFTFNEQQKLLELKNIPINRLMLHDRSIKLDYQGLSWLTDKACKLTKIHMKNIGCCSSPYTSSENCCMNAAIAREWSAKYNKDGEGSLPSSNHNSKESNCGCLRYILVSGDIKAVNAETKKKSDADFMNAPIGTDENGETNKNTKKEKALKEPKAKKLPKNVMPIW